MKWWGAGILAAVAMRAATAPAQPLSVGASLGLILPSERLVSRSDELGAALLPGPCVGLHLVGDGLAGREDLAWEGSVVLGLFQSSTDLNLRTQYLPLELGVLWEAAQIEQLSLRLRFGGGPAIVSSNLGSTRAVTLAQTYLGGQVQRSLHDLTIALDVSVGVLWQAQIQNVVRAQLVVLTR